MVPVAAAREVGEAGLGGVAVGRVALVEEEAVAAALVAEPYLVQVDRVAAELSPACAGENRLVLNKSYFPMIQFQRKSNIVSSSAILAYHVAVTLHHGKTALVNTSFNVYVENMSILKQTELMLLILLNSSAS